MSRKSLKAIASSKSQTTQQTTDLQPESLEVDDLSAQQPVSLVKQISPIGTAPNPIAHAAMINRAVASPQDNVVQCFKVVNPEDMDMSKSVDTRVNELVKNKETGSFNYKIQEQKSVGLRVSDDDEMAVPNVSETKDFYITESV
ncbi:hypothetical protein F7734_12440 [Scytonema sp. UIC 10036]|uniref:hypothetical protein n=1 Tax=Scytonema sp. UIC 10036 TaxID=2304196 RepID=UPI0012DA1BDC|nr:hypothetical protein [Scytonema sp. UIC 10036]MUG93195.1 hypothetical protein [Scytonema sp. UIC 10036]